MCGVPPGNPEAAMNVAEFVLLGAVALALLVYLGYTLLRPDRF